MTTSARATHAIVLVLQHTIDAEAVKVVFHHGRVSLERVDGNLLKTHQCAHHHDTHTCNCLLFFLQHTVDAEAVKAVFPYGRVSLEMVDGGLRASSGIAISELGMTSLSYPTPGSNNSLQICTSQSPTL